MYSIFHVSEPDAPYTVERDLYQEVTNKIIALIEQGVAPWRRTWSIYGMARNFVTGHIYSGINALLMNNTPHHIPYFMTFKQVQEQGGRIRKGAKAEMVIYFKLLYMGADCLLLPQEEAEARSRAGEEIKVLKFIKYYNVFNIGDVEGMEINIPEVRLMLHEKIERCERMIAEMPNPPRIAAEKGDRACYVPHLDSIQMPSIEQFESVEAFYATLFHELVHSTGHASRLAREAIMNSQRFGSTSYSEEELLAEMGASFLCGAVDINYDAITENSAAYLSGWLKVLKENTKFIFKAAAEAQKAVDYILGNGQG